jgi:hypothetical protein
MPGREPRPLAGGLGHLSPEDPLLSEVTLEEKITGKGKVITKLIVEFVVILVSVYLAVNGRDGQ